MRSNSASAFSWLKKPGTRITSGAGRAITVVSLPVTCSRSWLFEIPVIRFSFCHVNFQVIGVEVCTVCFGLMPGANLIAHGTAEPLQGRSTVLVQHRLLQR